MMLILDRYIGLAVIGGTLLVLGVLMALFSFVTFIGEQDSIGQANYGLLQAMQYVLMMTPRMAYQLLPLAALLGSLVGLGMLASQNELLVMRSAGISLQRIVVAVMKAGALLMLLAILLSELVVSQSDQAAREMRASALSSQVAHRTTDGFWTRNENSYINVHTVLSDGRLAGIHIYEFDDQQRLRRITQARQARFENETWLLRDIVRTEFQGERVLSRRINEVSWHTLLDPQLLDVVAVKPQSLSATGLYRYINYLQGNGLDAARYEMELWVKIVLPLATAVMVFLAVPFVFGSLRSVGIGQRIMSGALIGISFYLINQIFNYVGLAYQLNPVLSAILPTLLFFILAVLLMRRVA
jgi:lipopolysaccharide export system permease protein